MTNIILGMPGAKIALDKDMLGGYVVPLTACCNATGKGLMDEDTMEGYVGCRACYREVSDIYGTGWKYDDDAGWGWFTQLLTDDLGMPLNGPLGAVTRTYLAKAAAHIAMGDGDAKSWDQKGRDLGIIGSTRR